MTFSDDPRAPSLVTCPLCRAVDVPIVMATRSVGNISQFLPVLGEHDAPVVDGLTVACPAIGEQVVTK